MQATLKQLVMKVWGGLRRYVLILLILFFFLAVSVTRFRKASVWLERAEEARAIADERTQALHGLQGYDLGTRGPLLGYLLEEGIEGQTKYATEYRRYAREDRVIGMVGLALAFVTLVVSIILRVRKTSRDTSD